MKNDICQAISNCKICKMESPNLDKYLSLHLEIGATPMHFLAMVTIKIRDADSAYKYTFTLIDMLTNYVFVIPVKDICGKTLVHEYIYKVYLPFGRMEKFLSDNGTSFINEDWKNLAKALSFCHIQSSPKNPRANGCIKNVHNFLKKTMKRLDMATNPSSGMKQSRLQCTITTHFPVHQMDTHHSYFTSGKNAAIHYRTNSTQGIPSLGKVTLLHLCTSYTSSGRHTQLKSGKTD